MHLSGTAGGLPRIERLEERGHVIRVFLLLGQDALHHAARGRILVTEPADHLRVRLDGDALGDEVLLDHVHQRFSLGVLRVAAGEQTLRVEVRRTAELPDALGDPIGVLLFLVRVLLELLGDALAVDSGGHEEVAPVPEVADNLGGEGLVEQLERRSQVGLVVRRDGALLDVLAGPGGSGSDAADPSRTGAAGGVLLVTHLDTVPAGPAERWTETGGDPWTLTAREGMLFGLGCADVKLDALCKIEAARRLRGKKLARPFWLLGTCGEEIGLRGARRFAASAAFQEIRPRFVLCGEPSELQLITAHKGYAVVRCSVTDSKARVVSSAGPGVERLAFAGKAAHSSTPHLRTNAIRRALTSPRSSATPLLSAPGGTSANVVPASCVLEVPPPRDSGGPAPAWARFLPP